MRSRDVDMSVLYFSGGVNFFGSLGWLCVAAETYGAWGNEAVEAFSQLASRLATLTCRPKLAVLRDIYGRLNLHLVRANATAILTSCILN